MTVAQALDDANRVAPNMYFNAKYPETLGRYKGNLIPVPLKDYVTGKLRRSLIALWCAVGAILLIAGVNLSNLLLARAVRARQGVCRPRSTGSEPRPHRAPAAHGKPRALRRRRSPRDSDSPGHLIAWLAHQGSVALPLLSTLRIDGQALGWTVLIAVFTATIFGLLPGLKDRQRQSAGGAQGLRSGRRPRPQSRARSRRSGDL